MRASHLLCWTVRSGVAVTLAGLLGSPVTLAAQSKPSLVELARLEAERRKTVKDAKKVITAKDLPESARRPATPASPQAEGAPASSAPAAAPAAQGGAADNSGAGNGKDGEAAWRSRITAAREGLARNEMFLSALQSQVNGLTTDFVNRDDPYQRAKVGEERQKALDEMQRVKAEIQLGKKQIDDIIEDARKAGVPPGWLR
jgi:hypothetical protein